jgi:PAS domain S-box-containing protein
MPHTGQELSFRQFLKELGFFWHVVSLGIAVMLLTTLFHGLEFYYFTVLNTDSVLLHMVADFTIAFLVLGWMVFTLYAYRKRFVKMVSRHEAQFRRLLSTTEEAVIFADASGLITFWNPAAQKLTGLASADAIGKPVKEVLTLRPSANLGRDISELTGSDGRTRAVNFSELHLDNGKGELETQAFILRDVSEWLLHQAQMERSERLASLGHMAAGVAHEIGNPLASISGIIQLLQRKTTDAYQIEQLGRVRQNIDRITKIVRDMVDFSRAKNPEPVLIQLGAVVHDAVGLIRHDARCRNVHFEIQADEQLPPVKAVADQITQVMLNLLLNAVDALEETTNPEIVIHIHNHANNVLLSVTDNGKGIPPALHSKVFEPFFTTKEPGKGTGLGLPVAHHILKSCGATIQVSSIPGNTTFTIQFPIAA